MGRRENDLIQQHRGHTRPPATVYGSMEGSPQLLTEQYERPGLLAILSAKVKIPQKNFRAGESPDALNLTRPTRRGKKGGENGNSK